jgi:hypothetical protein
VGRYFRKRSCSNADIIIVAGGEILHRVPIVYLRACWCIPCTSPYCDMAKENLRAEVSR